MATTELMTPGEVAAHFGVNPKTVTKWADAGLLNTRRTMGGHRRFLRSEVEAFSYSRESMAFRLATIREQEKTA